MKDFFNKNSVLVPLFFNSEARKQAVLVHLKPRVLSAELYYRPDAELNNGET